MFKPLAVTLCASAWIAFSSIQPIQPEARMGEESFGNKPLAETNYTKWPGLASVVNSEQRVYQQWVNGSEFCCYQGDMDAINGLLKKYSEITCEKHELVLLPGPGIVESFEGKKVECDFRVSFIGGIASAMTSIDEASAKIWKEWPVATLHLSESVDLAKLVVPENVSVLQLEQLKRDCLAGFDSKSTRVRGSACGVLASLDPYDEESMLKLYEVLKSDGMLVALNALHSLAAYGHKITENEEIYELLKGYTNSPESSLKGYAIKTIKAVESAKPEPEKEKSFREQLKTIREYCESR